MGKRRRSLYIQQQTGRYLGGVATAALLMVSLPSPATQASGLSNAQQQLQQANQRAEQLRQQIGAYQQQEASLNQQIAHLDDQINAKLQAIEQMARQINQTKQQIAQKKEAIAAKQHEIEATHQRIAQRQQYLDQRLRATYEDGTVSYLEVLFSATSFSDFLTRLDQLTFIAQQDRTLLKEQQADLEKQQQQKAQLAKEQEQLVAAQDALSQQQRQLVAIKDALQQQQSEKRQQLGVATRGRNLAAGELTTTLAQAQQMQAQIKQLQQQEAARQAAAAAAARAASSAAGGASSSGSSGGSPVQEGVWAWPLPGHSYISTDYGFANDSVHKGSFHDGIDIPAPLGTPIHAAGDGIVIAAGPASGYGDWIVIDHGNGIATFYGHMYPSGLLVSVGEHVRKGQVIALVGSNGFSTGPHLHFGASRNGASVNPWTLYR
ncbi:MAG: peptidoglycan DD-metalloendopeptidase family protein [Firmicutes bacterium]|nr:peptidoglycan DD-metalloendopeptidase family protein [Bacillota bacterium]